MPVAHESVQPSEGQSLAVADLTDIEYESHNVMAQLREATMSPSPLAELLQDPVVLSTLSRPRKKKERRGSTSSHRREPRSSTSMMSLVLAEEERQAQELKHVLRSTGDRLEHEIRRADQAESRAERAERRAVEATARSIAADQARHQAELDSARSQEEIKRYQLRLEVVMQDLHRAQADVTTLTRQRDKAEEEAARSRDTARQFQLTLKDYEAREEGREEGRQLGMEKVFKNGRSEGWEEGREVGFAEGREESYDAGRSEGYESGRFAGFDEGSKAGRDEGRRIGREEGRKLGITEGFEEGRALGRKEEREHAMHCFDRFLASEMNLQFENPQDRTQRWVESPYHIGLANSPPPRPVWLHRRVYTDSTLDDRSTRSSHK